MGATDYISLLFPWIKTQSQSPKRWVLERILITQWQNPCWSITVATTSFVITICTMYFHGVYTRGFKMLFRPTTQFREAKLKFPHENYVTE